MCPNWVSLLVSVGTHQSGQVTEFTEEAIGGKRAGFQQAFSYSAFGTWGPVGEESFFSGYALKWNIRFLPGMI